MLVNDVTGTVSVLKRKNKTKQNKTKQNKNQKCNELKLEGGDKFGL